MKLHSLINRLPRIIEYFLRGSRPLGLWWITDQVIWPLKRGGRVARLRRLHHSFLLEPAKPEALGYSIFNHGHIIDL